MDGDRRLCNMSDGKADKSSAEHGENNSSSGDICRRNGDGIFDPAREGVGGNVASLIAVCATTGVGGC